MRPRTFAALALALITLLVGVPSAAATDPFPLDGVVTLSNDNFTLHYDGNDRDTTCASAITQQKAGEILGMLDRARSFYLALGWPAPATSGGRVEVSVDDFAASCIAFGAVPFGIPAPLDRWDSFLEPTAPGVDTIHLNATTALSYPFIAHEVFHLVEDAMVPGGTDQWLQEATAEWAAVRANKSAGGDETTIGRSLDCVGSSCGDTEFDKNGYPGWMLIEYLAERYGDAKVKALWDQVAASSASPATTNLAAVIDVPLATFYNDFANARMTGSFTHPALKGTLPAAAASFTSPTTDSTSDDLNLAVNHLAAAYVVFKHATNDGACFEATLTINVTIPAGVESHPAYWAGTAGATAQALALSGSSASATVPWNTCGASADAYLSLPNDSLDLDGREFVVKASITVDFNKPASATTPPPGAHVIGTVVPVPASDPAPTLKVYAPEVLRVSTKTRLLRFVVFSSGEGKLQATLGSSSLGLAALRSGNNDVRFVLPTQLFKSLRAKSVSNVLSLTSQSPTGAKGATFTRKVVVQTPPKPKKKQKKH